MNLNIWNIFILIINFLNNKKLIEKNSFGRPGVEFYGHHKNESGEKNAVTKIIAVPNEVSSLLHQC